jgi:FG-GAP repeat
LAIAVPGESIGSVLGAGAVNVIYGSSSELSSTSTPHQIWHRNVGGVEDAVEEGDLFGDSLAIADFNNDGYSDLAIGSP